MAVWVDEKEVGIRRMRGVSQVQFIEEIEPAGKPVIFDDAIDDWEALGKWSPEYFTQHHGQTQVPVRGRGSAEGQQSTVTIADLVKPRPADVDPISLPYLTNWNLNTESSSLAADCQPYLKYANPDWLCFPGLPGNLHYPKQQLELLYGQAGCGFPVLHFDRGFMNAFIMQIYGEKEFFVFPPDQVSHLYPESEGSPISKIRDVLNPDLAEFPNFEQATGARFTLKPGDTLFVPGGWWHITRLLTTSIGVTCNSVTQSVWRPFVDSCREHIQLEDNPSLQRRLLPTFMRLSTPILRAAYRISPTGFPKFGIGEPRSR